MRLTDVRPSIIVGSVPVGAMILALLQACAASAASCTPISVTTCCEYDSNPCPETHSNSSFDGVCNDPIIKMLTYQVTFPDAAFWSGTLIGSGAAANPGTCVGIPGETGAVSHDHYQAYWPQFYSPQTGDGYALLSEADYDVECRAYSWCGGQMNTGQNYCSIVRVTLSSPNTTYIDHKCGCGGSCTRR